MPHQPGQFLDWKQHHARICSFLGILWFRCQDYLNTLAGGEGVDLYVGDDVIL